MENVVLIVHLLLALSLIGIVLMQRSEGGALGIGGGGGGISSRPAMSPLAKVTWALAIAFIITSMALTFLSAKNAEGTSVVDRLGGAPARQADSAPAPIDTEGLLPPPADAPDAPLVPKAD
ncbi:preprotein translocase subunit SecG [Mesobacterium sp. TK19101]|uniref:Protein-export membrane protein SecG n=1 Tax=Mesobacterium hydrothermale TaxID=3111907 RepID=A0ABU6HK63_9RHOB|nr:preprotein translocase subunit SecG [Mesobacterium sp. TK19101]MEC3862240.1 preprotein translocase subunit SecG [Mesobacterium sp. TK19101]